MAATLPLYLPPMRILLIEDEKKTAGFIAKGLVEAGYSVECALKACIARATRRHEFPNKKKASDSYSHNLNDLLKLAGLGDKKLSEARRDPQFEGNWLIVTKWTEESRYRRHGPDEAKALVDAIGSRTHGVIRWIRLHW